MLSSLVVLLLLNLAHIPQRSVLVVRGDETGSGVILNDKYVLTAEHLAEGPVQVLRNAPIRVVKDMPAKDRVLNEVIKRDKLNDLALVGLPPTLKGMADVPLANSVGVGDPVVCVSYPLGLEMLIFGRVSRVEGGITYFDMNVARGSSGGGVYNGNGELMGMISAFRTDEFRNLLLFRIGEEIHQAQIPMILGRYFASPSLPRIRDFLRDILVGQ
jgi:S1-C subfamily serine protease